MGSQLLGCRTALSGAVDRDALWIGVSRQIGGDSSRKRSVLEEPGVPGASARPTLGYVVYGPAAGGAQVGAAGGEDDDENEGARAGGASSLRGQESAALESDGINRKTRGSVGPQGSSTSGEEDLSESRSSLSEEDGKKIAETLEDMVIGIERRYLVRTVREVQTPDAIEACRAFSSEMLEFQPSEQPPFMVRARAAAIPLPATAMEQAEPWRDIIAAAVETDGHFHQCTAPHHDAGILVSGTARSVPPVSAVILTLGPEKLLRRRARRSRRTLDAVRRQFAVQEQAAGAMLSPRLQSRLLERVMREIDARLGPYPTSLDVVQQGRNSPGTRPSGLDGVFARTSDHDFDTGAGAVLVSPLLRVDKELLDSRGLLEDSARRGLFEDSGSIRHFSDYSRSPGFRRGPLFGPVVNTPLEDVVEDEDQHTVYQLGGLQYVERLRTTKHVYLSPRTSKQCAPPTLEALLEDRDLADSPEGGEADNLFELGRVLPGADFHLRGSSARSASSSARVGGGRSTSFAVQPASRRSGSLPPAAGRGRDPPATRRERREGANRMGERGRPQRRRQSPPSPLEDHSEDGLPSDFSDFSETELQPNVVNPGVVHQNVSFQGVFERVSAAARGPGETMHAFRDRRIIPAAILRSRRAPDVPRDFVKSLTQAAAETGVRVSEVVAEGTTVAQMMQRRASRAQDVLSSHSLVSSPSNSPSSLSPAVILRGTGCGTLEATVDPRITEPASGVRGSTKIQASREENPRAAEGPSTSVSREQQAKITVRSKISTSSQHGVPRPAPRSLQSPREETEFAFLDVDKRGADSSGRAASKNRKLHERPSSSLRSTHNRKAAIQRRVAPSLHRGRGPLERSSSPVEISSLPHSPTSASPPSPAWRDVASSPPPVPRDVLLHRVSPVRLKRLLDRTNAPPRGGLPVHGGRPARGQQVRPEQEVPVLSVSLMGEEDEDGSAVREESGALRTQPPRGSPVFPEERTPSRRLRLQERLVILRTGNEEI